MLFGSLFEVVEGFVKVALYALNWFTVRFGIGLSWLETYLGLICFFLRIGSKFNENLFKGGFRLYFNFTKGQFIFLFQVGQGFSLELVQHLFTYGGFKIDLSFVVVFILKFL